MRKLVFLFTFVTVSIATAFAQDITSKQQQKIIPPSPDAAALGKYGNIPVSTYTGVPQIAVPMYTVSVRDINIPLSLSYHSAGFTVEEEAGWTGLGWTLNVGGVITRQIRGKNDMARVKDGFHRSMTGGSSYWISNFTYKGYPYDPAIPNPATQAYITDVCLNNVDPEPDLFYFNFLGRSGSFVLEKGQDVNGIYLVGTSVKAEKIDIRFDMTIGQWVISTTDGFKYYFGTKELQEIKRTPPASTLGGQVVYPAILDEEAYTDFYYYNSEDFNVTGWYLDKIVSPQGEIVNYVYDLTISNPSCYNQPHSVYGSVKHSFTDQMDKVASLTVTGTNGTSCFGDLLAEHTLRDRTQTYTAHVYLKEIQFSNGSLQFTKSDREDMRAANSVNTVPFNGLMNCAIGYNNAQAKGPQKLDAVLVKDAAGNVIKKFEFSYSYFNDSYTAANKYLYKRLKLTGVRECGSNTTICKPYTNFYYNETVGLPSKYGRGMDFWGYYNGANSNATRVPFGTYAPAGYSTAVTMGNADRQPNGTYMKAGVLNKIVYPTGGWTELEFEPHDYYYYGNGAWQITNFENNNVTITGLGSLSSVGGSTADLVQPFSLTEPTQININRTLAFIPTLQQSATPCCAPNPFSGIDGNGVQHNYHYSEFSPYIEIRRQSDNALMAAYNLGEYQGFLNTCVSPCNSSNNAGHGATYNATGSLSLAAGNYNMVIKQHQHFQSSITIDKRTLNPRVIPLNANGVYAKTAGGLRVARITDYDGVTNVTNIKKYDYTTLAPDGSKRSTGRLMMFPINHVLEGTTVASSANPNDCAGTVIKLYGKSYSAVPLGNSASGGVVGYDKITVIEGPNGENGKTEFAYENVEESLPPNAAFIYGLPNITNTGNGNLLSEKVYTAAGALLKQTDNQYTRQLLKNIPSLAYRQTFTGATANIGGTSVDMSCYSAQANQLYNVVTDRYVTTKTTETQFNPSLGQSFSLVSDMVHDAASHLQLTSQEITNSKGEKNKTLFTYTTDASWIPTQMWQTNYLIQPVRQQKLRDNVPISDFKMYYALRGDGKTLLSKTESAFGTGSLQIESEYVNYDEKGNLLEFKNKDGILNSFDWSYGKTLPVVKIINAGNHIEQSPFTNNANMIYYPNQFFQQSVTFTQTQVGNMSVGVGFGGYPGATSTTNTRTLSYTLTGPTTRTGSVCVSNNGTGCSFPSSITFPNMPVGQYTLTVNLSGTSGNPGSTVFYSYQSLQQVSAKEFFYEGFEETQIGATTTPYAGKRYNTGDFTVPFTMPNSRQYKVNYHYLETGIWKNMTKTYVNNMTLTEGDAIDEVRVYPSDALMTTYTYTPGTGMSTETDPNGKTLFYEYDELMRLQLVRDQDRNIIKKICYNYTGQPENCTGTTVTYQNTTLSQTFTKNNCAAGFMGSSVTYTVPAGVYSSTISQAEANQLAQNDINANGQNYANTNGTCTQIKPVINSLGFAGQRIISVNYTAIPNCTSAVVRYVDLTNSSTSSSGGACTSPRTITVPTSFRTYRITVTCYSSAFPSGVTSDPMDIYVPF